MVNTKEPPTTSQALGPMYDDAASELGVGDDVALLLSVLAVGDAISGSMVADVVVALLSTDVEVEAEVELITEVGDALVVL